MTFKLLIMAASYEKLAMLAMVPSMTRKIWVFGPIIVMY